MASFTTSNVSNNLVGRELIIASSFVKQYYTLLNKAPCFIHNFYSHDSTFIHGTIEMANEHHTEPVVGREKIKRKMEDLKLNDCRAKIKQIDCLETLAGGLVIQVIGELSNNGKPMRRFLQTFVLAPSPDESRQDGDSQQHLRTGTTPASGASAAAATAPASAGADRRSVNLSENSNSSHNQKFFVLNSIFRYQDDGPDGEFEEDSASIQANMSIESTNGGNEGSKLESAAPVKQAQSSIHIGNSNGSVSNSDYPQARRRPANNDAVAKANTVDHVERLANDLEEGAKLNKPALEGEFKRDASGPKVVSNGTGNNIDKKNETSEKTIENGKTAAEHSQAITSTNSGSNTSNQPAPSATASRPPQPSNEPKTYANMVRNAHPPSASIQVNVNKTAATEQQQSINQPSSVQPHHQQSQQMQQQQQQQQPQQQQQQQQSSQNNNNNNNRRRHHMMRKPSNKSTGRSIKNRPRPPAAGKPAA